MIAVSATEFAKNFGVYKEQAEREPVAITSYGRTTGYFLPAHEYEEYLRLKAGNRRVYDVSELPDATLDALKRARMDSEYDHLNALLDE